MIVFPKEYGTKEDKLFKNNIKKGQLNKPSDIPENPTGKIG